MTTAASLPQPIARKPLLPSNIFGMLVAIVTEVMFFIALISAFLVIKGDGTDWVVPDGVRLPVIATAYNTLILLLSGALLVACGLVKGKVQGRWLLGWSAFLGACFVAFQGYEWVQLLSYGLTMKSSIFGACFFLLIGAHGVHAVAGVLALIYLLKLSPGGIETSNLRTVQLFWLFVVGIWPILYLLVYF